MAKRYVYQKPHVQAAVGAYDLIGKLIWNKRAPKDLPTPKKIAYLALHQIGDVVMDLPTISAIQSLFPEAKGTIVAGPGPCELLAHNSLGLDVEPFVANWQKVTRQLADPNQVNQNPQDAFLQLIKRLDCDIAVLFHSDIHLHKLMAKTNVPVTVGFDVAGGGFHLTHALKMPETGHQVERTFLIAQTVAKAYNKPEPTLSPPTLDATSDSAWAQKRKELGLKNNPVVLHPFGSAQTKNWRPAYWEEVIRWLLDNKHSVAIIGGPKDNLPLADDVAKEVTMLAGSLSLRESALLLAEATLFIGIDSGPGHIAGAVGATGITIFSGVNDPTRWRPFRNDKKWAVLHEPPSDRKAYPLEQRDLPGDGSVNPYCDNITPDMVIQAIKKVL